LKLAEPVCDQRTGLGDYIYSSFGYPSYCGDTGQVHQHLLTMTAEVAPSLHWARRCTCWSLCYLFSYSCASS